MPPSQTMREEKGGSAHCEVNRALAAAASKLGINVSMALRPHNGLQFAQRGRFPPSGTVPKRRTNHHSGGAMSRISAIACAALVLFCNTSAIAQSVPVNELRSEERRVGKEG